MKFTHDNLEYCLLTFDHNSHEFIRQFASQSLCLSGLFSWAHALGGYYDFPRTRADYSKYNLVHINLTPANLQLVPQVLERIDRSATKLIMNVDHSVDLWPKAFSQPYLLLQELDKADYIFAVEETQADTLSKALGRPVPCIPHPVAVSSIKELRTSSRQQRLLVSVHRYDKQFIFPWFLTRAFHEKWVTTCIGAGEFQSSVQALFDEVLPPIADFSEMVKLISKCFLAIDSYTALSYGRLQVECAALSVPCIGSPNVSSQVHCWPSLCCKALSLSDFSETLHLLMHDQAFYKDACKHAWAAADYYSYETSARRMIDFLNSPQ